ncbi:MAG: hypothetical protein K8I04_09120 [Gammaproteobacteria bacterium]|nr:hypothetical protein [Gammaproteobacteria bacterium]
MNRQDAKENLVKPPRRQDAKKIIIHEKSWRLGALAVSQIFLGDLRVLAVHKIPWGFAVQGSWYQQTA